MKIELIPGVRYAVTVATSVGSPMGLAMLRNRLQYSGFDAISITPSKDEVTVSARYCGSRQTIDIAYDVRKIEAVV